MTTAIENERDAMNVAGSLSPETQLAAMLETVGVSGLTGTGWIRVTGSDAVRWLNGMVTNSIQELRAGDGNYSFALNAQGRIQGDLWTYAEGDGSLLLATGLDRVAGMMAMFDRFIIMDDVVLEDVSAGRGGVGIVGPRAADLIERLGIAAGPGARTKALWEGVAVEVIVGHGPVTPRREIWVDAADGAKLLDAVTFLATEMGGGVAGDVALEWLRVLEATPRYGVDIRDKDLAQETGQTRALHFAKGCYLGQEIVERIRSRGNVHRGFGAFRLAGALPAAGAVLEAEGKAIGELTSVAAIPLRGQIVQVALGYARREAVERGVELTYRTDRGPGQATPLAVPVALDGLVKASSGITQS